MPGTLKDWGGEGPGRLPWWRLGRPTEEELLRRKDDAFIDEQGRSTARWRPRYGASEWLEIACARLGVDRARLADRNRNQDVVRARELIGLVGVERFGVKVNDLARELGKSRDGVSRWIQRGQTDERRKRILPLMPKLSISPRARSHDIHSSAKQCLRIL